MQYDYNIFITEYAYVVTRNLHIGHQNILCIQTCLTLAYTRLTEIHIILGFKGILLQQFFYRPNLIFWIAMGFGKAHFGRKGQKTPKIENFGLKFFPLGSRGDPHSRARGNLR